VHCCLTTTLPNSQELGEIGVDLVFFPGHLVDEAARSCQILDRLGTAEKSSSKSATGGRSNKERWVSSSVARS
jgi:hypothetical protein